jgi:hypothetical protein
MMKSMILILNLVLSRWRTPIRWWRGLEDLSRASHRQVLSDGTLVSEPNQDDAVEPSTDPRSSQRIA